MSLPKLRIIHETNPQKYFPALFELVSDGKVELVGAHRYSVCKEWVRGWLRERLPLAQRTRNAWSDLRLRLSILTIKNETIVIGFAPWDWRLLLYRFLAKHNKIIYHTSWHDWRFSHTPRQLKPRLFQRYMQHKWLDFVKHPNVSVVAVTPVVATSLEQATGVKATVIPHAVPAVFFDVKERRSPAPHGTLRLLFVGEVSEKKGIKVLLALMKKLADQNITLTVVGNGPLVSEVQQSICKIEYLGPIYDRERLAQVMAQHDVLLLLSQKTPLWEELFGIVIVESLAAGCGVIASDHIGPRGILGKVQNNGLVEECNISQVIDLLMSMIKGPEFYEGFLQRQNIANNYAVSTVKAAWYNEIVR